MLQKKRKKRDKTHTIIYTLTNTCTYRHTPLFWRNRLLLDVGWLDICHKRQSENVRQGAWRHKSRHSLLASIVNFNSMQLRLRFNIWLTQSVSHNKLLRKLRSRIEGSFNPSSLTSYWHNLIWPLRFCGSYGGRPQSPQNINEGIINHPML